MIIDVDYEKLKGKKVSGIYSITNLKNGKIYIGQSTHLRHRISDYLHIHERPNMTHPIAKAIKTEGTDNFIFKIVFLCPRDKLSDMEKYYIEKYNAMDDKYGYNQINHTSGISEETSKNMSKSYTGMKESVVTKRKKSNAIFIFNKEHHDLYISDSAKLFGDYINRGKDMIKNCLRNPSRIGDYYVYYANLAKREEINQKLLNKRSIRNLQFVSDISLLNNYMRKGVETIYRSFNVYRLTYDVLDKNDRPIPLQISNGYSSSNDEDIEFRFNEEYTKDLPHLT